MSDGVRGVFIFDSANSSAFLHGCGKQPSLSEVLMTLVLFDAMVGHISFHFETDFTRKLIGFLINVCILALSSLERFDLLRFILMTYLRLLLEH